MASRRKQLKEVKAALAALQEELLGAKEESKQSRGKVGECYSGGKSRLYSCRLKKPLRRCVSQPHWSPEREGEAAGREEYSHPLLLLQ
ncbi:hypothetical protein MT418_004658 [Batrachochytrium dendrobatidis]